LQTRKRACMVSSMSWLTVQDSDLLSSPWLLCLQAGPINSAGGSPPSTCPDLLWGKRSIDSLVFAVSYPSLLLAEILCSYCTAFPVSFFPGKNNGNTLLLAQDDTVKKHKRKHVVPEEKENGNGWSDVAHKMHS
jgi:hypothetical protein